MKNIPNEETIVLLGTWDVNIINPEWMRIKLFDSVPTVELEYNIGTDGNNFVISINNIYVRVVQNRLIFGLLSETDEAKAYLISRVEQFVDIWPMPLQAIGMNFLYISEDDENPFETLELPDDGIAIFDEKGWNSVDIERHYSVAEGRTVNYKVTVEDKGICKVAFNYDFRCKSDLNYNARESLIITNLKDEYSRVNADVNRMMQALQG